MGTLVALGAAGLDTIFAVPRSWRDGHDASAKLLPTECVQVGEGMASSAAAAAARLGASVELWSRVGDDIAGDQFIADISGAGVDIEFVRRVPGRTTIATILVDPDGERLVVPYYDPEQDASPGWLPLDRLSSGSCICFLADPRWVEGAVAGFTAARKAGVPSVLDADTAPAAVLHTLVPLADHVIFSESGMRIFAGKDDADASSWDIADMDAILAQVYGSHQHRSVGVTMGSRGWRWLESPGGCVQATPSPAVKVRDTLAAGDVFHGVFAMCVGRGLSVHDAGLWAGAAAAFKCTKFGGRSGAPTPSELIAFIGAAGPPWAGLTGNCSFLRP